MNFDAFKNLLKDAFDILDSLDLIKDHQIDYMTNFSNSFKVDYYKFVSEELEKRKFTFLLNDDSFFQFHFKLSDDNYYLRYSFFENILDYPSFEDFTSENGFESENIETVWELYQDVRANASYKKGFLSARYDFQPSSYKKYIHAISHMHIGYNNHIRITCEKLISPVTFVFFILKHKNYQEWKIFIQNDKFLKLYQKNKSTLREINYSFGFQEKEYELFLA